MCCNQQDQFRAPSTGIECLLIKVRPAFDALTSNEQGPRGRARVCVCVGEGGGGVPINPQCAVEGQRANVLIVLLFMKPRFAQVTRREGRSHQPSSGRADVFLVLLSTAAVVFFQFKILIRINGTREARILLVPPGWKGPRVSKNMEVLITTPKVPRPPALRCAHLRTTGVPRRK